MLNVDSPNSRYLSYNVLERIERWDSHTKEIIRRRLGPLSTETVLSVKELSCLAQIAYNL